MQSLSGLAILVVEDESLVSLAVEEVLTDAGAEVIGSAPSVHAALRLVAQRAPDAVILDVNLSGEMSTLVAADLRHRGIPFVVTTGYSDDALGVPHRGAVRLTKPYEPEALVKAVRAVTAGNRPGPDLS